MCACTLIRDYPDTDACECTNRDTQSSTALNKMFDDDDLWLDEIEAQVNNLKNNSASMEDAEESTANGISTNLRSN